MAARIEPSSGNTNILVLNIKASSALSERCSPALPKLSPLIKGKTACSWTRRDAIAHFHFYFHPDTLSANNSEIDVTSLFCGTFVHRTVVCWQFYAKVYEKKNLTIITWKQTWRSNTPPYIASNCFWPWLFSKTPPVESLSLFFTFLEHRTTTTDIDLNAVSTWSRDSAKQ